MVRTVLAGALAGTIFLGAGGRVAMALFALATGRSPGFTLGGTLSVILSGAIAGVVGGVVLAAVDRLLPRTTWLRGLALGALCYLIAIPGFRPPRPLVFALFAPLFAGYGVTTLALVRRLTPVSPPPGQPPSGALGGERNPSGAGAEAGGTDISVS